MGTIPFLIKYIYGVSAFGLTIHEQIISLAILFGFINGFQLLMFGLICAIDYERRYQSSKKLGEMVSFPGLPMDSIFPDNDQSLQKLNLFIDLQKRINVFSWMNIRKVMRSFGEAFYLRIQSYTSILIFYSLFCVGILNLIVWSEIKHHISTIYIIGLIIFLVSSISIYAITKAIKLQSLSAKHRDFVRNELFIIEEEIWELRQSNADNERIVDLTSAKALLEQVDESINYKELIYKPTTIFGYAANNGVMGSVLSLVLTGVRFAVQGFVSTGINYDNFGWFNF
jgi:hypothetical protein